MAAVTLSVLLNLSHHTQKGFKSMELKGTGINNALVFLASNLKLLCSHCLQIYSREYNFCL